MISDLGLRTVCDEACCPNRPTCWSSGEVTFMILGDLCTRSCRFCGVRSSRVGRPVESDEGRRIAVAAQSLGITHLVVTSVTRDDLPDGGASNFAECIRHIRESLPATTIEVLIPDLPGEGLDLVLGESPDVLGHNVEVVESLQTAARDPRADYHVSLEILRRSKLLRPDVLTKSSLMLGLGEGQGEVLETMGDLAGAGVDILTIGQYLKPSDGRMEVERYVTPGEFDFFREEGYRMGFAHVLSGPFARSSYMAGRAYREARARRRAIELL
jgi:lipoic acid synthetase